MQIKYPKQTKKGYKILFLCIHRIQCYHVVYRYKNNNVGLGVVVVPNRYLHHMNSTHSKLSNHSSDILFKFA